MFVQSANQWRS